MTRIRHTCFGFLITVALVFSQPSGAQQLVDRAVVDQIRREGLDNSQVYRTFSQLVNVIGPRLTATPEYKLAADWSRKQDYVGYDVRTHHTNVDSFERVRETDLKQSAVILASFAYEAAMQEEKMARPSAPHRGFRNRPVTGIRGSSLSSRPVVELLS